MMGLFYKDLCNLRNNLWLFLGVFALFGVVLGTIGGDIYSFVMWGMIFSIQTTTTFTYDDATHWGTFAMTFPVTRKTYVRSKYLLHLFLMAIGYAALCVFALLGSVVDGEITVTFLRKLLMMLLIGFILSTLSGSISIPLILKLGTERARLATILVWCIPMLAGIGAGFTIGVYDTSVLDTTDGSTARLLIPALCILLFLMLLLELATYHVSCRIFEKKDLT